MTFDYDRAALLSRAMLDRFGQNGAIRRETPGNGPSYDPGEPTLTDHPTRMAVTKYTAREIDGSRIRSDDLKVLVAPDAPVGPTTADRLVTADGDSLAIVNVTPLKPAGTVVLYTVQCRTA